MNRRSRAVLGRLRRKRPRRTHGLRPYAAPCSEGPATADARLNSVPVRRSERLTPTSSASGRGITRPGEGSATGSHLRCPRRALPQSVRTQLPEVGARIVQLVGVGFRVGSPLAFATTVPSQAHRQTEGAKRAPEGYHGEVQWAAPTQRESEPDQSDEVCDWPQCGRVVRDPPPDTCGRTRSSRRVQLLIGPFVRQLKLISSHRIAIGVVVPADSYRTSCAGNAMANESFLRAISVASRSPSSGRHGAAMRWNAPASRWVDTWSR